jgi:hypothetical protein
MGGELPLRAERWLEGILAAGVLQLPGQQGFCHGVSWRQRVHVLHRVHGDASPPATVNFSGTGSVPVSFGTSGKSSTAGS